MKKLAIFNNFNREAAYGEFLDFIEDCATAFKMHNGQKKLRQRLERKTGSHPDRLPMRLAKVIQQF